MTWGVSSKCEWVIIKTKFSFTSLENKSSINLYIYCCELPNLMSLSLITKHIQFIWLIHSNNSFNLGINFSSSIVPPVSPIPWQSIILIGNEYPSIFILYALTPNVLLLASFKRFSSTMILNLASSSYLTPKSELIKKLIKVVFPLPVWPIKRITLALDSSI